MALDTFNNLVANGGQSALPIQKLADSSKNKQWRESSVNYYVNFRYTNGSNLRSDRNRKIINYDLYNGIINPADMVNICNPIGIASGTFDSTFLHLDKISQPLHLLLDDESEMPDNSLVYSEAPEDLNRKQVQLKDKIVKLLQEQLMAEIDPSTIDPNNPPPTPEQVLKAERYSPSDMIESKANRILKILKKRLNTKWYFNQGFKDALIVGEEIYWTGIQNGEPILRKCNPLNITVVLDDSDVFLDDALAVIEERLLTVPSILDEFGDQLDSKTIDKLVVYSQGTFGSTLTAGGFAPQFSSDLGNGVQSDRAFMSGVTPSNSYMGNNVNNYAVRVTRVEWMSMKQVGTLSYTDVETGEFVEKLVDEIFFPVFKDFLTLYPDAQLEKFWINEAWEGTKIGQDIYLDIQPKRNQRRRMDNPYYCKLGYSGFIYEATNSKSVSLIDRIKPYQYLYDAISYKVQNIFASDMGKIFLMDLAQIPRSEGIDIEKWMYYLKEMKIGFINSFEEGRKLSATGKMPTFNQFQAVDMSLANSVQMYINYLQYIEQQIYSVSGVNPQRLGAIKQDEAVTNVQQATAQSAKITGYLFDAHNEVKRRVYTSLIEVAKLAWRNGKVMQYVNDDLGMDILQLEEFEFENSEFSVFVSNLRKDEQIKAKLDQLAQIAMEQSKADLSTIIDTIVNDSPKDIIHTLKAKEQEFYQRQADAEKVQQEHEQQVAQMQQEHEQALQAFTSEQAQLDRDLEVYKTDSNNQTKIQVQELANYFQMTETDVDADGTPDMMEVAANALDQQELHSDIFSRQQELDHEKDKHSKEYEHKNKELELKKRELVQKQKEAEDKVKIEKLKIEQTNVQNRSQEKIANQKAKSDEKMMEQKMKLEAMKAKAAIAKSKIKPKPAKKK